MEPTHSLIESAYQQIEKYKKEIEKDPYRLQFHMMPLVGLLNDPNGFIYFKGSYHMFYQWNPFETDHGPKFWGHKISKDLVHWEECPIALAPENWFDKNGCYSGSAIEHDGKMYVFYTGNVRDKDGHRKSYQCLAISEDGIHFEKKGPVIHLPKGYTAHFRDPKVWKENGVWKMVIGAQTEDEYGEVVSFSSKDLWNWEFHGTLAGSFHQGLGNFGYMWECPDLFELDDQEILIFCPQGLDAQGIEFNNIYQSGYVAGKRNNLGMLEHGEFRELDRGFDFYAPQTTLDHKYRRVMIGWMGMPEEQDAEQPTVHHHWIHALTLPRVLSWENGQVYQRPIEEVENLRGEEYLLANDVLGEHQTFWRETLNHNVYEMQLRVKESEAFSWTIIIGETTKLLYDSKEEVFTLERRGFTSNQALEQRHCKLKELRDIRLFKDTSSIEIFLNDGEEVFTARIFDNLEKAQVAIETDGQAEVDVKLWYLTEEGSNQHV